MATLSGRSSAWPRVSRGDSSEHFALWAQHAPRTIFSWVERVSLDEFIDGSSDRQCRPSAGISECLHRLSSGLPASRTVNYYAPTIAVRMP